MPNTIVTDEAEFEADMTRLYELLALADAGGRLATALVCPPPVVAWPFDRAAIMIAAWQLEGSTP